MTAPAERPPRIPASHDRGRRVVIGRTEPAARGALPICPYLMADGKWRSAEPTREHRCTAVEPPAVLGLDKQRRLCLDALHLECPTRLAAVAAREARLGSARTGTAQFVRTTPIVLERSRPALAIPDRIDRRRGGQAGLIVLMVVALAAVVISRIPADHASLGTPPPTASASSAGPSQAATVAPSGASPLPTVTSVPTASAPAPASASPSAVGSQTYRVKAGDTLTKIAAQYHTTIAAIEQLNGIKDPRLIRVGQLLKIP